MSERDKAIEHITKEIETTINNIYTFRIRSAFTVWIGPFLLLGSVIVAKNGVYTIEFDLLSVVSGVVAFVLYMGLGIGAGVIEKTNWKRCDDLRKILMGLISEESINIDTDLFYELGREKKVVKFYIEVFLGIAIIFIAATLIISSPPSP